MAIEFDYKPEQNSLAIRGELTINYAAEAITHLRAHENSGLDLADISELDGAGLQLIIAATRDAGMRLVAASDPVADVLRLVGLTGLMETQA